VQAWVPDHQMSIGRSGASGMARVDYFFAVLGGGTPIEAWSLT